MGQDTPRDAPWVMRTYSGHSTARASNELYRNNLAKGQTGLSIAFDLPTQTGLRPGLARGGRRGGQGGGPGGPPGPHGTADGPDPRGRDEHLHDHQRHGGLAARPLRGPRRGPGRRAAPAVGDDAERHRQGVPEPGHLHLPPGPQPPPDRRHHRLHGAPRAQVESDQRLQLPPPGGGGHADPGGGLRPGHRHRRARRGAPLGQDRPVRVPRRGRPDQLLRQLERALRRGDLQDAGLHRHVGPHLRRALRGRRPQAAPLPLRRAGQLARPDRAAAREQRAPDRARDRSASRSRRAPAPGPCSCRPGTRPSACRARGTSSGRCASSRSWPSSPTCSSTATSSRAPR